MTSLGLRLAGGCGFKAWRGLAVCRADRLSSEVGPNAAKPLLGLWMGDGDIDARGGGVKDACQCGSVWVLASCSLGGRFGSLRVSRRRLVLAWFLCLGLFGVGLDGGPVLFASSCLRVQCVLVGPCRGG